MQNEKFILTNATFSAETTRLGEILGGTKVTAKEINRAQLLVEEIFFSLYDRAPDSCTATVVIQKRFGDVNLRLTSKGEGFNPLEDLDDWPEGDINYLRSVILKSNRDRLAYTRKNGNNIITIRVHRARSHQLRDTMAAIAAGLLTGYLMQSSMDLELIKHIDFLFFKTAQGMFMDALGMMATPLIFSAIVLGITDMANDSDVGRIMGKLSLVTLLFLGLTSLTAMGMGVAFFTGGMEGVLAAIPNAAGGGTAPAFSFRDMIAGIVPKNLVIPFTGENILQTLFLAILSGVMMNKMGAKAQIAKDIVDFLNKFATEVMNVIIRFIPLIVFLSMISLVINANLASILSIGKLVVLSVLFIPVFLCFASVFILFMGKVSPLPFVKKFLAFSPLPLTVGSSAALSGTLKLATESFGIEPKLALFAIPAGMQITHVGNCANYMFSTVMMARVYGTELIGGTFAALLFISALMAVATPPVPGGGIICMGAVFVSVGIPVEAVSLLLCINPVISMLNAVANVCCELAATFIVALTEKMANVKTYMADN